MTNRNTNNRPQDAEVVRMSIIETNDGKKRSGEELEQLGARFAGRNDASPEALGPALNGIVQDCKVSQARDEKIQKDYKAALKAKIESLSSDIETIKQKIARHLDKIQELNNLIQEQKEKIEKARNGNRPLDRVYFAIGILINFFLGVYLFVFYSSASYSAFFRPENDVEMGNAIFYPKAYGDAWSTSFGQFLFVLLMPVIFLGLGFLLHRFTQKQGAARFVKIAALYAITFIFDALLAFEISEKMYIPTLEIPNYTMSMAFDSPNFWIIIFAGFIAYVIWGLVFDFTMDSYAEMTMGLSTIKDCEKVIDDLKAQIDVEQQEISKLEAQIGSNNKEIASLNAKLANEVVYDTNAIKKDLNSFFQGWISFMKQIGSSDLEVSNARGQLDAVISELDRQAA